MKQGTSNTRMQLSQVLMKPSHSYNGLYLGFELDIFNQDGWKTEDIEMHQMANTRKIDPELESTIDERWAKLASERGLFDSPRARYEGCMEDLDTGKLHIFWSEDSYKNHAVLKELKLPRQYQVNPYTINGIPYTLDKKIPIATRNPKNTDQGRIRHIVPAGFCDLMHFGQLITPETGIEAAARKLFQELRYSGVRSEDPHEATGRELDEELTYKGQDSFPQSVFNPRDMRLLGIIYNSYKNFDYAASVFIPLNASSNEIQLKGGEHESLEWVNSDYQSLANLLYELALSPEENSGHLRGDITLAIAHLYGEEACKEAVEGSLIKVAKHNLK